MVDLEKMKTELITHCNTFFTMTSDVRVKGLCPMRTGKVLLGRRQIKRLRKEKDEVRGGGRLVGLGKIFVRVSR